jgi:hypothetical protein
MAEEKLFERININAPGRINLLLDSRFQTVTLDTLPQDKLQQLYENDCRYVGLTQEGKKKYIPKFKEITVKEISPRK